MNHPIFAQQPSGLTPLAADAMKQAVLITFLVGQHSVFVPDADNAMPATVAQRHYFTQLAIPMKGSFNRFSHKPGNVSFGGKSIQHKIAKK
jgi:hypothetical protein